MNTTTLAVIFAAAALLVLAACAFAVFTQRSVIRLLQADNVDLRNRLFASKGHPPVGTDMAKAHEQKQAARDERRQDPRQKSAIDPTKAMRNDLANREKTRTRQAT